MVFGASTAFLMALGAGLQLLMCVTVGLMHGSFELNTPQHIELALACPLLLLQAGVDLGIIWQMWCMCQRLRLAADGVSPGSHPVMAP